MGRAGQGVQTLSIRRRGGKRSLEPEFRHLVIIRSRSVSFIFSCKHRQDSECMCLFLKPILECNYRFLSVFCYFLAYICQIWSDLFCSKTLLLLNRNACGQEYRTVVQQSCKSRPGWAEDNTRPPLTGAALSLTCCVNIWYLLTPCPDNTGARMQFMCLPRTALFSVHHPAGFNEKCKLVRVSWDPWPQKWEQPIMAELKQWFTCYCSCSSFNAQEELLGLSYERKKIIGGGKCYCLHVWFYNVELIDWLKRNSFVYHVFTVHIIFHTNYFLLPTRSPQESLQIYHSLPVAVDCLNPAREFHKQNYRQ